MRVCREASYGLNWVPHKNVEVLIPRTSECGLGKQVITDAVKMR